jgi:hypothetical protein
VEKVSFNDCITSHQLSDCNNLLQICHLYDTQVVGARDVDHSNAWDKYSAYKRGDAALELSAGDQRVAHTPFVTPGAIMEKLHHDDYVGRKPKKVDGRGCERTRNQTLTATSKLYGGSRNRQLQKQYSKTNNRKPGSANTPKKTQPNNPASTVDAASFNNASNQGNENIAPDDENSSYTNPDRLHAKRLVRLNQLKDRLRGNYIRFDVPNGLDDTAARFVMAVAQRYNFACPESSTLHNDSFIHTSDKRERQKTSLAYAESIIQQLHAKGLVFVRQLQPTEHLEQVLSGLNAPGEFVALASQLMHVLHQTQSNYMSRKYLMSECKNFLLLTQDTKSARSKTRSEIDEETSCLEEFGIGESDDLYADIPGGLWASAVSKDRQGNNVPKA